MLCLDWLRCLFELVADCILEFLPGVAVERVAQLAIVVHFAPAISSPFASSHVDDKVAIALSVVDVGIFAVVATGARWEAVDLPLVYECEVCPDPRLVGINVLESVLLLVLPLHVLLLVADRVPPYIQQAICPCRPLDKERSEVEASTVLRYDDVDRLGLAVADW